MRAVLLVDKRTRKVLRRFNSAAEASRAFGKKYDEVSRTCRLRRLGTKDYYLRYEDDFDPNEDFTGKVNCPCYTVNLLTGENRWFPTRRACEEAYFVSRTTAHKSIAYGSYLGATHRVYNAGKRHACGFFKEKGGE